MPEMSKASQDRHKKNLKGVYLEIFVISFNLIFFLYKNLNFIAGSLNLFWKELVSAEGKMFKSEEEIKELFKNYGVFNTVDVFCTCRTGMMASVLFVGLEIIGHKRKALYNGSWLEYGT